MKKVLIAGILALVVIGCVLAAGCTTTTSNTNQASGTMTDIAAGTTSEAAVTTAETPKIDVTFHWTQSSYVTGRNSDSIEYKTPMSETVQIDQGSDVWVTPITFSFCSEPSDAWFYIHYIVNGEEKVMVISSHYAKSVSTADNRVVEFGEKLTINEPMDVNINR